MHQQIVNYRANKLIEQGIKALLLICLLINLAAPSFAQQPQTNNNLTNRSNKASYLVRCQASANPIPLNEPFNLNIVIAAGNDKTKLITDAVINIDAVMPAHGHGMMVAPAIHKNDDGSFVVEGMQFHMAGDWEIYLDITRAGITERTVFKLDVE